MRRWCLVAALPFFVVAGAVLSHHTWRITVAMLTESVAAFLLGYGWSVAGRDGGGAVDGDQ